MAETPAPLLVHNRIDANRRNTRVLLICFGVLMLPATWGVSQLLLAALTLGSRGGDTHTLQLSQTGVREHLFGVCVAVATTATILCITYLTSLFSSFILWSTGARPLGKEEHPDFQRLVENLCVGAGLPPPRIHITNSDAPNAFAIGFDPKKAKLVVSRGLLALLDRRELSGVIAHELSHIANRDTNLSTLLAAVTTAVRLPQTLLMGVLKLFRALGPGGSVVIMLFYGSTFLYVVAAVVISLFSVLLAGPGKLVGKESLGQFTLMLLPMYVIGLAPATAAFLRKKISHEREFLADADAALLTNDPEGVALALAKVTAAVGVSKERDPATAHMFFVDPAPPEKFSWLRGVFPTHPDPEERIELLTRMGDGIVEGLEAASDAGVNYRGELLLRQYAPPNSSSTRSTATVGHRVTSVGSAARRSTAGMPARSPTGSQFPLTRDETPLYEKPDGWSAIVQTLSAGLVVTVVGFEGNFVHVLTDRGEGYIPRGAIAARAAVL